MVTLIRGGQINITLPNFVPIGQMVAEMWPFLDFSRWRLSLSWICFSLFGPHEENLAVFATVQNLVGIGAVVTIVYKL